MSWQRITVSTGASVGAPGALPPNLLGLAAGTLANLPAELSPDTIAQLELADTGFVWVADPAPPPTPPAAPQIISRMQAQLELHATASPTNAGKTLLDDVNTALAASTDPTLEIYWNTATDFHRDHPKLTALATSMGLTSAQVDDLFITAAQLS